MGTKQNPGEFDCYAKAEDDEPMFILLARDPLAPILVDLWAELRGFREDTKENRDKIREADWCAAEMKAWRRAKEASGDSP